MYEFEPLEIDYKEVREKLEGTTLNMKTVGKKMMNAVNKQVSRQAKANFKANFDPKNHSWEYDTKYKGKIKPTLSSFKYRNSKKEDFASFMRNYYYVSIFQEYGATIIPKNGKYLVFKYGKDDDGNDLYAKVSHPITHKPQHFLKDAVNEYYANGKGQQIMQETLDKILADYWNKDKPITETAKDNATHGD